MEDIYIMTSSDALNRLMDISSEQKIQLHEVISGTIEALLSKEIELPTATERRILREGLNALFSMPISLNLKNGISSLAESNEVAESDIYTFVADRASRGVGPSS